MQRVQREAKQRLRVDVTSAENPGGGAGVISFAFPLRGQRPATFTAGAWATPEDTVLRNGVYHRTAYTPRIGEGALDLAQAHYRFFGKLVIGSDEDIWEVDDEGLEVQ